MKHISFYETAIGKIGIGENGTAITDVYMADKFQIDNAELKETALLEQAAEQLLEYLNGKRLIFTIPFILEGTEFQQRVWKTLQQIPYGEVWSYKKVAEAIGQPKASRAVGMANNRNPVMIIVPCHRVIGANGKLVGYGGGLDVKEHLLQLEKRNIIP